MEKLLFILEDNSLIQNAKLDLNQQKLLQKLEIIDKGNSIRIELLQHFMNNNETSNEENLSLRTSLSTQEYNVFTLFQKKKDEIVELDEISQILWEENEREKYSLWSIYKVISNLNKKIKKFGYRIKNYRGRGYGLIKS